MRYCITLISFILYTHFDSIKAQELRGYVVDAKDKPIENVRVYSKSELLSKTDKDGVFRISNVHELPLELKLEHPKFYLKYVAMTESSQVFKLFPLTTKEQLGEVEIISKNEMQRAAALFPSEVISSTKIEEHSPKELVTTLNEVPGLFVHSGAINTNRITIRGIGSRTLYGTNKIRAYYNDIPITNGTGETSIDIFDPEFLHAINIIKGPKDVMRGSSLGGTLLLQSKVARSERSFFQSSFTAGSYGLLKNTITAATASGRFDLNLHYDFMEIAGYRENDSYRRKSILLDSGYELDAKNKLSFLILLSDFFAQLPSSIGRTAFELNPRQAAQTWKDAKGYKSQKSVISGFSLTHRFSDNARNKTTVFYSYEDHYEPRPFNILDEYTNGFGGRTTFKVEWKNINMDIGGEWYQDTFKWRTIENLYKENNGQGSKEGAILSSNIEHRQNLNLFLRSTVDFTQEFTGELGFNLNKTNYRFLDDFNPPATNTSGDRSFVPILAPSLTFSYKINRYIHSYLNISRGFNFPTLEETLAPDGIINPELGPEVGINYEWGNKIFLFDKKLLVDLNLYLLDVRDLLVAKRIGDDEYIGRNAGKTIHKGIELQLNYLGRIGKNLSISPSVNLEYSGHRFVDFKDQDNDYSGNLLTGVPNKKISAGLEINFNNLRLNTRFLHVGSMPMNDANTLFSNSYSVMDLKIEYSAKLFKGLSLASNVGINNIFDEKYASSILINATGFGNTEPRYYYPGLPRNWFAGAKLAYFL